MNLRLLPAVVDDAAEVAIHYRDIHEELATRFRGEFASALNAVSHRPYRFPISHDGNRRARLRVFPYFLYFKPEEDEILVVLLIHAARDPATTTRLLQRRNPSTG